MKSYPKVSIIFPNYNGGKEPLECLSSTDKLNYPKEKLEVIVVDNNSKDGSDIKIKSQFPQVILIKNKKNFGFAKAVNLGIKKSSGSYVFVGNDDLVFEKNSLKNLIDYSQNNPGVGILGGKIFYKSQPKKLCSSGHSMNKWTGNVYPITSSNRIKELDWIQGCALLVPRKVLDKIGLFDPGYYIFFEDFDLAIRARDAGFKVVCLPEVTFWHGESLTVDKNKTQKYFHWYQSKIRFVLKNLPLVNILSILFIQTLFIIPYWTLILHDGRLKPFLKGLFWNLRNLNKTLKARKEILKN